MAKNQILDIPFDNVSIKEALSIICKSASETKKTSISFINAHYLNVSVANSEYSTALKKSDFILPDGSGVNLAGKMLGIDIKENVNGTDLLPMICQEAEERKLKLFFLGAEPGIAEEMTVKLQKKFPALIISGTHHGYINQIPEAELLKKINEATPDILFVGMGAPIQEVWIQRYLRQIRAQSIIGVGGLFDFYSGRKKRAPEFLRKLGLEWCFRLYLEPRRLFKRYIIGNPLFLWRVLLWKFKKKADSDIIDETPELTEK